MMRYGFWCILEMQVQQILPCLSELLEWRVRATTDRRRRPIGRVWRQVAIWDELHLRREANWHVLLMGGRPQDPIALSVSCDIFREARRQGETLFHDGDEHVHRHGDPNLRLDGVPGGTEESLDAQVLLNPTRRLLVLGSRNLIRRSGSGKP